MLNAESLRGLCHLFVADGSHIFFNAWLIHGGINNVAALAAHCLTRAHAALVSAGEDCDFAFLAELGVRPVFFDWYAEHRPRL